MTETYKSVHILIVHSSAELYGSDRSLLDFVRCRECGMQVTVALPEHGILVDALENAGAKVIVGEVCKVQRGMLSPQGFLRTTLAAWRTVHFLGGAHREARFDLVYSNTVAVLGGALCARLWKIPHIWHVREILTGSNLVTSAFRYVVAKSSSTVICNSGQTLDWIRFKGTTDKYRVIWNGFDVPNIDADRLAIRASLGALDNDVLFVLIGRINAWKGHKLLIEAFSQLVTEVDSGVRLAIIGSAPAGQEHYEKEIEAVIAKSSCANLIKMIPYREDIDSVWIAADVVVVPSTEPEPFGRVAIEAMGFAKPVIAAGHGGLIEIVVDGSTGLLFTPRDANALSMAMRRMVKDANMRIRMGNAGKIRQLALFSVSGYANQLNEVMRSTLTK